MPSNNVLVHFCSPWKLIPLGELSIENHMKNIIKLDSIKEVCIQTCFPLAFMRMCTICFCFFACLMVEQNNESNDNNELVLLFKITYAAQMMAQYRNFVPLKNNERKLDNRKSSLYQEIHSC